LKKFKIISVDMFQTLVDVNSRREHVWKKILGDVYSQHFAKECWEEANKVIFSHFNKYVSEEQCFRSTKYIFEKCYEEVFPQKGVKFDPKKGAEILASEHGYSCSYEDTEMFLKAVGEKYPICLVSDTDGDMVLPLLKRFKFDKVFLSEEYQCYKFDPKSDIFHKVINYYKVDPSEIIHIGDGYSDVVGANRAGIKTCWLNRHGANWSHEIMPDYTVTSLREVASIIGVEMEYSKVNDSASKNS
jgi:HAD superfamily hydrolase (TIGR01549 family)